MVDRISKEEAAKQFSAADKRIKGISSIADSTIKRTKVLEVEKQFGTIKGNKQAVSSVDRALRSLTKSTQALAMGVKLITVETARGVKNITQTGASVVGEYTKALGEDIHMKREGMLVALTAKTTPLIGYAIAKLFETSVFRNMIERMKSGLNRALESVSSRFKKLASAGWEKSKEFWNSLRDKTSKKRGSINVQVKNAKKNATGKLGTKTPIEAQVPHMAKGGYVKKEGLAKVHAAEVVQPVGKVVEQIVEQVNKRVDEKEKKQKSFLAGTVFESSKGKKAKDFFGFEKVGSSIRNAFEIMTRSNLDLERQIMRRDKTEQRGLVKSFITAYSEEAKQEELPLMERQVQATIELKKTISGENKVRQAAWNKMLYEHPVFHAIYAGAKATIKYATLPVKMLFKKRGLYANRLSSRGTVFERLLDAMTNTYTGLMEKMDGVIGNTYISASATAKANNGKAQGLTKAPKQPGYTLIGAAARLSGKLVKKGLGVASKIGKWTIGSKMTQAEWDKKVNLVDKVKNKYSDVKDKTKGFISKKASELGSAAGEKRDSLLSRGKEWWGIKNLNEQKLYDKRRDFEKEMAAEAKKINKEDRAIWLNDQKLKLKTKIDNYKEYVEKQKEIHRKSKTLGGKAKVARASDIHRKNRKEYENYKREKGDKDKTGKETQFKIFKDIRKINRKTLKENITQSKSGKKLTKYMTGFKRWLVPILMSAATFVGNFVKDAANTALQVASQWGAKILTGIGVLGGGIWAWVKKSKAANIAANVAKKTKVGKVGGILAKGAGLASTAVKGAGAAASKSKVGQSAAKIGAKVTGSAAGIAAKKAAKSAAVKGAGKIASKAIPGLGILAGLGFAAHRLMKGQFIEAGLELTSGLMGGSALLSGGVSLGGMAAAESALAYRDYQRSKGKYDKKHKNLSKSMVKRIKNIQNSTSQYLPIFAGFTGSATAMISAGYLNKLSINNPEALVKAADKISGVGRKAWEEAGGSAKVYEGAKFISKSKKKILDLWDDRTDMFDDAVDKTKSVYEKGKKEVKKFYKTKGKKFIKKGTEKAQDMYQGFKQKAFDIKDNMPDLMSNLSDNIVTSFMKFGNFMSQSIGDPVEHYQNMKEKVFKGITSARNSLASMYSKLHDIFELLKSELQWKKISMKMRKTKESLGIPEFEMPQFVSPLASISAAAGAGFKFNQDDEFMMGKGHKGETLIQGGKNMTFMTPDNVRETLFGGLGIPAKDVATMSARQGIHENEQNDQLQNSINGMKDSVENSAKANAGVVTAMIDKSIKVNSRVTSQNTSSNNGMGRSSRPIRRDPYIDSILGGRIT